jgi:hypothetical protein
LRPLPEINNPVLHPHRGVRVHPESEFRGGGSVDVLGEGGRDLSHPQPPPAGGGKKREGGGGGDGRQTSLSRPTAQSSKHTRTEARLEEKVSTPFFIFFPSSIEMVDFCFFKLFCYLYRIGKSVEIRRRPETCGPGCTRSAGPRKSADPRHANDPRSLLPMYWVSFDTYADPRGWERG